MSQRFFPILSIAAIAVGTAIPAAQAQFASNQSPPRTSGDGALQMVMVDQAQLSESQKNAFQRFLQTANLPPTKIGKSCQFYGKPQVWCLLLDQPTANQVYQQLSRQSFGSAASMKTVHRLKSPDRT